MDFNDDFLKPVMYRDIMSAANTPMGASLGGIYGGLPGMYPTNLLGGMTMPQGLKEDIFQSYQKRQQKDLNFIKKTLLVLGGLVVLDLMKFRGLKNVFSKIGNSGFMTKIKNFFKPASSAASTAASSAASTARSTASGIKGWWQRTFSRRP